MQPRLDNFGDEPPWHDIYCFLRYGLNKCHADRYGYNFTHCRYCPLNENQKKISRPSIRKEPTEQRCLNFNSDSDLCWQCMNKMAGQGKICYKTSNPVHIRNRKNHHKRGRTLRDQQAKEDWQNFLKEKGLK